MQDILSLKTLQRPQQAIEVTQIFMQIASQNTNFKETVNQLFDAINKFFQDTKANPQSKLVTLYIFKCLTDRNQLKVLSLLANHQVFKYLSNLAGNVDPKKLPKQKGKNLFPNNKEVGNHFMILLLELIIYWGQKFQKNKKSQPTKFRKVLNSLIKNQVQLPQAFTIMSNPKQKKQQNKNSQGSKIVENQKPSLPKQTPQFQPQNPKQVNKIMNELRFTINKIQGLINLLQDQDSLQIIDSQIRKYHEAFQRDNQKYEKLSQEILASGNQQAIDKYFRVMEYIGKQQQSFYENIQRGDHQSHIQCLFITYQSLFPNQEGTKRESKYANTTKRQNYQQNNDQSKQLSQVNANKEKFESVTSNNYEVRVNNKTINKEQQNQNQSSRQDSKIRNQIPQNKYLASLSSNMPIQGKNSNISQINNNIRKNTKAIQNIINQIQSKSRSKSPINGFAAIKNQIEKQKKQIQSLSKSRALSRSKTPQGSSNNYHMSKASGSSKIQKRSNYPSSCAKSRVDDIFLNPPNQNAPKRHFSGQVVSQNRHLIKQIASISKIQGHRRFKMGHFKQNYVLFENQQIQVGFKSQMITQKVDNFFAVMGIQLFFGNKIHHTLLDAKIQFKGDQTILLYATNTQNTFDFYPGEQLKYQMAIIPKDFPFNYLTLNLSYQHQGISHSYSIKVPTSVTKLIKHYPVSRIKFDKFQQSQIILKTDPFILSHHFPPKKLNQKISNLVQLTDYQDFKVQNSTTDYVLIGCLSLLDEYEALLKIIIRPDLKVIIQIGMQNNTKRLGQAGYRFFIQTLQGILKQTQL